MNIRPPTTMARVWLAVVASRMMLARMTTVIRLPTLPVSFFMWERMELSIPVLSMMAP